MVKKEKESEKPKIYLNFSLKMENNQWKSFFDYHYNPRGYATFSTTVKDKKEKLVNLPIDKEITKLVLLACYAMN